jgi:hypothetical protein
MTPLIEPLSSPRHLHIALHHAEVFIHEFFPVLTPEAQCLLMSLLVPLLRSAMDKAVLLERSHTIESSVN